MADPCSTSAPSTTYSSMIHDFSKIHDPYIIPKINKALKVIRRTLALYPGKVGFSFNGGKDSTVLLHLLRAALAQDAQGGPSSSTTVPDTSEHGLGGIHSFFFIRNDDFNEVEDFVRAMDAKYNLQLSYLTCPDFKQGLQEFIDRTGVAAIVLGTRRGDPNAGDQEFFSPSSEGWPPFMRVNPVIDWSYHDVWAYLRAFGLDYCCLYDHGYTSLGSTANTRPNTALQNRDGTFSPAYLLADGSMERDGRKANNGAAAAANGAAPQRPQQQGQAEAEAACGMLPPPSPTSAAAAPVRRAAVLAIGDELLAGKVEDHNTHYLCQQLRALGWRVARVAVIPDDVPTIAAEVRSMSAAFDLVITSGGVGPTLDDVTLEGVALAFGRPLARHPGFEQRILDMFGPATTPAHTKMADLPEGETELIEYQLEGGEWSRFPLVRCRNVYVLPGVPYLLRQKWLAIRDLLTRAEVVSGGAPLPPFKSRAFRLVLSDETAIAPALDELARRFRPAVLAIGSYPVTHQQDGAGIIITLDSKLPDILESAAHTLRELLPANSITSEEFDQANLLKTTKGEEDQQ